MENFYQIFGAVAALSAGVIILAVFFTVLGYFKKAVAGSALVQIKGLMREGSLIDVHLSGAKTLSGVRLVGFTQNESGKGAIPFQIGRMVVFEKSNGSRIFVRPDTVRMLEEVDRPQSPAA